MPVRVSFHATINSRTPAITEFQIVDHDGSLFKTSSPPPKPISIARASNGQSKKALTTLLLFAYVWQSRADLRDYHKLPYLLQDSGFKPATLYRISTGKQGTPDWLQRLGGKRTLRRLIEFADDGKRARIKPSAISPSDCIVRASGTRRASPDAFSLVQGLLPTGVAVPAREAAEYAPPGLIGRDLKPLVRMLQDVDQLTIHGVPGVGKSAVVRSLAAHEALNASYITSHVAAGAAATAERIRLLWAKALHIDDQQTFAHGRRRDRYQLIADQHGEHPTLLIVDDVWDPSLLGELQEPGERVSLPAKLVIATQLPGVVLPGGVEQCLGELESSALLQLFIRELGIDELPADHEREVTKVLACMLPLPLEIVAAAREVRPLLRKAKSPEEVEKILSRFKTAEERLLLKDPDCVRQHLEDRYAAAISRLPKAQLARLRRCGIFAKDPACFSFEEATCLIVANPDRHLNELVKAGVLFTADGGFRVHSVHWEVLQRDAHARERERALDSLSRYYVRRWERLLYPQLRPRETEKEAFSRSLPHLSRCLDLLRAKQRWDLWGDLVKIVLGGHSWLGEIGHLRSDCPTSLRQAEHFKLFDVAAYICCYHSPWHAWIDGRFKDAEDLLAAGAHYCDHLSPTNAALYLSINYHNRFRSGVLQLAAGAQDLSQRQVASFAKKAKASIDTAIKYSRSRLSQGDSAEAVLLSESVEAVEATLAGNDGYVSLLEGNPAGARRIFQRRLESTRRSGSVADEIARELEVALAELAAGELQAGFERAEELIFRMDNERIVRKDLREEAYQTIIWAGKRLGKARAKAVNCAARRRRSDGTDLGRPPFVHLLNVLPRT